MQKSPESVAELRRLFFEKFKQEANYKSKNIVLFIKKKSTRMLYFCRSCLLILKNHLGGSQLVNHVHLYEIV